MVLHWFHEEVKPVSVFNHAFGFKVYLYLWIISAYKNKKSVSFSGNHSMFQHVCFVYYLQIYSLMIIMIRQRFEQH